MEPVYHVISPRRLVFGTSQEYQAGRQPVARRSHRPARRISAKRKETSGATVRCKAASLPRSPRFYQASNTNRIPYLQKTGQPIGLPAFPIIYFSFLLTCCIIIARTFNGRPNRVMKPSASWWSYSSPVVKEASSSLYREYGEVVPALMMLPL